MVVVVWEGVWRGGVDGCSKTCKITNYSYEKSKMEEHTIKWLFRSHIQCSVQEKETNAAGKASFACVSVANMTCMVTRRHAHTHARTYTERKRRERETGARSALCTVA